MEFFWRTGLMLGFSLELPQMFGWLIAYLDILILFLFLFYKIANNINPRAKYSLSLHRIFIIGFILNIATMVAVDISGYLNKTYSSSNPDSYIIWTIITLSSMFFMGSFIERKKFSSLKEENLFLKSITSKNFFFPIFFIGMITLVTAAYLIALPVNTDKYLISTALSVLFLLSAIFITREFYIMLNGKIRPVFIYFTVFPLMVLIPLFSWLFDISIHQNSAVKSCSVLSFIFAHPVFSILSVWNTQESYSSVDLFVTTTPTWMLAFVFYPVLYICLKLISTLFLSMRKKKV
jgi:hypothetical protein